MVIRDETRIRAIVSKLAGVRNASSFHSPHRLADGTYAFGFGFAFFFDGFFGICATSVARSLPPKPDLTALN